MTPPNHEEISAEERAKRCAKLIRDVIDGHHSADYVVGIAEGVIEGEITLLIAEAAEAAYLSCLRSGNEHRYTQKLGLRRSTSSVEYAKEAKASVRALIHQTEKEG